MKKTDWQKRIRRLHFNLRRKPITLVGDEGKPYRTALYILSALVLVIIVALASREEPQIMASAEVQSLQDRGVLRVGVRYDVPGLGSIEGGLEHDLARLLTERLLPGSDTAASLQLIEVNAMTLGTKLDVGGVDVVLALASSAMASKYSYSIPYYSDPCVLVAMAGSSNFLLENMEIGVVQSNKIRNSPEAALLGAYIADNPNLNLKSKTYASYPDMLDALAAGSIRAVLLTELYVVRYSQDYPIISTAFSIGSVNYALCSASDSAALAQLGTLLLNELKESGGLAALYMSNGLNTARIPAAANGS